MLWEIARCAPSKTFQLVEALSGLGVRAWTPAWVRRRQARRSQKVLMTRAALLPSIVFVEPDGVEQKQRELGKQVEGLPEHSFLIFAEKRATVREKELETLRAVEEGLRREAETWDGAPKKVRCLPAGATAKILTGPFAGLLCVVQSGRKGYNLVEVEKGFGLVKIPALLLEQSSLRVGASS